jgi:hypothetical protein
MLKCGRTVEGRTVVGQYVDRRYLTERAAAKPAFPLYLGPRRR